MPSPTRSLPIILICLAALAAGVFTARLWHAPAGDGALELQSGTWLPKPRAIPEFSLQRSDGGTFTREDLLGHWSVIFVGFTHCPDICPNTLGLLKNVHRELSEQSRDARVVFLSVDPERDSPEVLQRYVSYFDPSFVGATGEVKALEDLGRALGFVFLKSPGETPESYSVDHSSALIVVNPQAQVAAYLTPPLKADALVADLSLMIPDAS